MSPSPPRIILAVNAGSSSLKLQVFSINDSNPQSNPKPKLLIKSSISGITSPPAKLKYKSQDSEESSVDSKELKDIETSVDAFNAFLSQLEKDKAFGDKDSITHICHRIVHGGELGEKGPTVVDDEVIKELEEVTTLAPL